MVLRYIIILYNESAGFLMNHYEKRVEGEGCNKTTKSLVTVYLSVCAYKLIGPAFY